MKSSGNIATIAVVAGGALLVGGAILFFTAPGEAKTGRLPLRIGLGLGSLAVGGTFR